MRLVFECVKLSVCKVPHFNAGLPFWIIASGKASEQRYRSKRSISMFFHMEL